MSVLFVPDCLIDFSVVMEHILMSAEDIDSVLHLALAHASIPPATSPVHWALSSLGNQMEARVPSYSQAETLVSTQEANERIQAGQFAQGNLQGKYKSYPGVIFQLKAYSSCYFPFRAPTTECNVP